MTPRPYTITLQYPTGEPTGLLVAKHTLWRGVAVAFPRALLGDTRDRAELNKPGVYVLSGDGRLYVGHSDAVGKRLSEHDTKHDTKKTFWNRAVVFVSETDKLNKAHGHYMEAELIRRLQEDGVDLENKNTPQRPSLSGEDTIFVDGFIEDILLLLPVLGVLHGASDQASFEAGDSGFLVAETAPEATSSTGIGPPQPGDYTMKVAGGIATLSKIDANRVLVYKGSRAVLKTAKGFARNRRTDAKHRTDLIESGVLAPSEDHRVFTKDQRFDSMGKAASVIRGSNTGADVWTAAETTSDE